MKGSMSIEMVGVGGQGILLASKILGRAALNKDINVIMSEVHGMAQRGGVVVTSVRLGDAYSPLIADGSADILFGFEPVETYRGIRRLKKGGTVLMNLNPMVPIYVSLGKQKYPSIEEMVEEIKAHFPKTIKLNATELAEEAGAAIAANVVMMGALSAVEGLPFTKEEMLEAVKQSVPPKVVELNIKAFELGYTAAINR